MDLGKLGVKGAPTLVVEGMTSNSESGGAPFPLSSAGLLVYHHGLLIEPQKPPPHLP